MSENNDLGDINAKGNGTLAKQIIGSDSSTTHYHNYNYPPHKDNEPPIPSKSHSLRVVSGDYFSVSRFEELKKDIAADIIVFGELHQYEYGFQNQVLSLDKITREHRRIIDLETMKSGTTFYLSEPAGYGKSALLRRIAEYFCEHFNKYQSVYIDITKFRLKESEKKFPFFDKNRLFLFDNMDKTTPEILGWLETFNTSRTNATFTSCVVFSGRYIDKPRDRKTEEGIDSICNDPSITNILKLTEKNRIELGVLDIPEVCHCLETACKNRLEEIPAALKNMINEWAVRIINLSCGHPGVIIELVKALQEGTYDSQHVNWSKNFLSDKLHQQLLFREVIEPKIQSVFKGDTKTEEQKEQIVECFTTLSIFSCINLSIVNVMKKAGEIHIHDALYFLQNIRLICKNRKDDEFYADALTRRLFLKRLQLLRDEETYSGLLHKAMELLLSLKKELVTNSDSYVVMTRSLAYARQYLYLSIQYCLLKQSYLSITDAEKAITKIFQDTLNEFGFISTPPLGDDEGIKQILRDFNLFDSKDNLLELD